jgi:hypothetical protein
MKYIPDTTPTLTKRQIAQVLNPFYYPLTTKDRLNLLAFFIAALQFLLRLGCINNYGFHQDELLYMSLSEHLDWGYRETPPFIAFVGKFSNIFIGDSIAAMRLIPSLCAAATVYITGRIAMRLGGNFFAITLACLGIGFSSAFLASGALFIPQVFDQLCWSLAAYLTICFVQTRNNSLLRWLGVVIGIGLLIKYTIILYAIGLLIGLLIFSPQLRLHHNRYFWFAIAIALLIFSPNLIWQYQHGLSALAHYHELQATQLTYLSRGDFMLQQIAANGTGIVLWTTGIWAFFRFKMLKSHRFVVVAFLFVMLVMLVLNGKPYYAFGTFPALFAAGGIFFERYFRIDKRWKKIALTLGLLLPNLLLSVIVLPYLPIQTTAKVFGWMYQNLDMHYPLKWEDQKIHNMNQNYADMIGWEELAIKTSQFYQSLPAAERKNTVVFTDNYGVAGAIDYYQNRYLLPQVVSLRSSYSLWAPADFKFKNMIYINEGIAIPAANVKTIAKQSSVKNPYSRIRGMDIYLIKNVNGDFSKWYSAKWKAQR